MGKIILGLAAPHNPNITSRPEKISVEVQSKLDSAFGHLKKQLSETTSVRQILDILNKTVDFLCCS